MHKAAGRMRGDEAEAEGKGREAAASWKSQPYTSMNLLAWVACGSWAGLAKHPLQF